MSFASIGSDFGTRTIQERTHDAGVRIESRKTASSRIAHDSHQDGLDLIVACVAGRDASAGSRRHVVEKLPTRIPPLGFRRTRQRRPPNEHRKSKPSGRGRGKSDCPGRGGPGAVVVRRDTSDGIRGNGRHGVQPRPDAPPFRHGGRMRWLESCRPVLAWV